MVEPGILRQRDRESKASGGHKETLSKQTKRNEKRSRGVRDGKKKRRNGGRGKERREDSGLGWFVKTRVYSLGTVTGGLEEPTSERLRFG